MEKGDDLQGPWRATRLWNSIIRTFRAEMPLKKHKKNMRTYENCFSSTEAVEFLHRNLQKNPNFGSDVTKEQTVQLLKKLYRAGIIENVKDDAIDEEFKVRHFN
jgi:predicted transcriptional regulator YheO